jgi:hypothetical protein
MQHKTGTLILVLAAMLTGCSPEYQDTEARSLDLSTSFLGDFEAELADVVIDVQPDGSATVEALDKDGELIGRIGLLNQGGDIVRVISEYADGEIIVDVNLAIEESEVVEQTIAGEEAIRRARLIEAMIAAQLGEQREEGWIAQPGDGAQAFNPFEGWAGCGAGAVLTVASCVPTPATVWAIVRCPITAAGAACACVKAANGGKAKKPCGKEKK